MNKKSNKNAPARLIAAALTVALAAWAAQGPAPARADALDDAYSDGKLFGAGIPTLSWGAATLLFSIRSAIEREEFGTAEAVFMSIGVAQIAGGAAMLGVGAAGRPDEAQARVAFNAGSDVGAGATLVTYGSVLLLNSFFQLLSILDYPEEDNSWAWVEFALGFALAGFHVGYGAYIIHTGGEDFDRVRASGQAAQPLLSVPLVSFSF